MNGFIKLHRQIENSQVFEDPHLLKTWLWILCRAVWKPVKMRVGIEVQPGEFITTYRRAAEALSISPATVKRQFKQLEFMEQIALKSDTRFTVVSVCNYRVFQTENEKGGAPTAHGRIHGRIHGRTHGRTQEEETKETKEREEGKTPVLNLRKQTFVDWITYKQTSGAGYTPQQLKAFKKTVEHLSDKQLQLKVTKAIANGWKGLGNYDKEPEPPQPRRKASQEEIRQDIHQRELRKKLSRLKGIGAGMSDEAETIKQELQSYEG
jgi:hypothetical protein